MKVCVGYSGLGLCSLCVCYTVCVFPLRYGCFVIRKSSQLLDGWLCLLDKVFSVMR